MQPPMMMPLPFSTPHLDPPAQSLRASLPACFSPVHTWLSYAPEPLLMLFLCLEDPSCFPVPHIRYCLTKGSC